MNDNFKKPVHLRSRPIFKNYVFTLNRFRSNVFLEAESGEDIEYIVAFKGGWVVLCLIGDHTLFIGASARKPKRAKRFRTLDAAVRWLQAAGARQVTVKLGFDVAMNWL